MADWTLAAIELDHEDRSGRDPRGRDEVLAAFRTIKEEEIAAARAREADRLRGLTLETLMAERPFSGWADRREVWPDGFVPAARARMHQTLAALAAPGPEPRRSAVRAEVKALATWFNGYGEWIDTEERDDIFKAVGELCRATGQKPRVGEIDEWRDFLGEGIDPS